MSKSFKNVIPNKISNGGFSSGNKLHSIFLNIMPSKEMSILNTKVFTIPLKTLLNSSYLKGTKFNLLAVFLLIRQGYAPVSTKAFNSF